MHPNADILTHTGFLVLPLVMAAVVSVALVYARRAAGRPLGPSGWMLLTTGVLIWLALPAVLAQRGVISDLDGRPPPVVILFAGTTVVTVALALSPLGKTLARNIPFAWLVASQVFRLPLELLMDHAQAIDLMPPQMSLHGYNFDIVTGIAAGVLGPLLAFTPVDRRWIWAWNIMGMALLINVVAIAIISMPMIAAFGTEHVNTWVTYWPFVWLPTVLVQCAVLGHLLVFRKLVASDHA